jgi:hypothetical protein
MYPSLAVDSGGNVHVAWHDFTDYGGDTDGLADIFYKRYISGIGWTTAQVVSTESTAYADDPSLAVDSSRNIHVAWSDPTNYGGDTDSQYDIFYKRSGLNKYYWLTKLALNLEGLQEVRAELESKGFVFDAATSNVSKVDGGLNRTSFSGTVLSWWSSNMDTAGRMAFIVAAMMDDGHGLVFGAVTNLIPPEILLAANHYVIVNAMPYTSAEWFYYDTVNNRIAKWSHWWYDSQDQPDWFWNIYWKWRNYINEYHGWNTYLPWWWWFWHYVYDKQWHNWAAQTP